MQTGSDALAFAADIARHLPTAERTDQRSVKRRHRDKEILRRMLKQELQEHPDWAAAVDKVLTDINDSSEQLDRLLERQKLSAGVLEDSQARPRLSTLFRYQHVGRTAHGG